MTRVGKSGEATPKLSSARITDQFRDKHGMVYDLKCQALRITISIAPSLSGDGTWSTEAIAKQSPDRPAAKGVGASRGQALRAAEDDWRSRGEAAGFPTIDWDAVREALATVRAI
jgi:hypothetical protein